MNQVKRYGSLRAKTFAGRVAEHHRNLEDFAKRAQTGQVVCISDLMANRDRLVVERMELQGRVINYLLPQKGGDDDGMEESHARREGQVALSATGGYPASPGAVQTLRASDTKAP